jgi:putative Holliday junction resolvase
MRILGIDYGSVRVGLALSDELGMLATPLETVEESVCLARISAIVKEKQVGRMVIGLPRNMDGSEGPAAQRVREFMGVLAKRTGLEVVTWDERLTTRSVERMLVEADVSRKKRKQVIDKLAAQQILQGYLDALSTSEPTDG